jgi:hypothetical protein
MYQVAIAMTYSKITIERNMMEIKRSQETRPELEEQTCKPQSIPNQEYVRAVSAILVGR